MTDDAPISIALEWFTTADDIRYAAYRRLKYVVFMAEQGWTAGASEAAAGMADPDPSDRWGRFWLAETDAGAPAETDAGVPIGVIRGVPVSEAFPHRDLFEHHLDAAAVRPLRPALGTVNALAVLGPYRGRQARVTRTGWGGGVGSLLLLASLRGLADDGVRAVVATTQGPVSARLFLRLGFRALDAPRVTPLQPRAPLMNVGLVVGSPEHRAAEDTRGLVHRATSLDGDAAALLAYFERRHRQVLGAGSLEDAFAAAWTTGAA